MQKSTMSTKGRIVIPSNIRKRYGLKPGAKIRFIERGNEIILQPVTRTFLRSVHGMLASKTSATKELLEERGRDVRR